MTILLTIFLLLCLSVLAGVLGRLGGAEKSGLWYDFLCDTKTRDLGVGVCATLAWIVLYGFNLSFWYIYIIVIGLHWAAFSTYWDKIFKFDNLGFSGFIVGLAALPLLIINPTVWIGFVIRAFILGINWFLFNKYLPSRVFCWRHDVAEEFLRYKCVII